MATPPTFIADTETADWVSGGTGGKTTAAYNVQVADALAAFGVTSDQGTATITSLVNAPAETWTQNQVVSTALSAWIAVWTAIVGTTQSETSKFTPSATIFYGGNVLQFRGSGGVGASNKAGPTTGTPSVGLTTQADNSAIAVAIADWNAVDGATRTWLTVNGTTPTSGNGFEVTYFRDSVQYTVYIAYYPDAGLAGAKTVGLSGPAGQKFTIVAQEIKGVAAAALPELVMAPMRR